MRLGTRSPNLSRGPISTIDMGMRVPHMYRDLETGSPYSNDNGVGQFSDLPDSVTPGHCILGLSDPLVTKS